MIDADVKPLIKNLDERLTRVEQFLPALATKADLALLATKAESATKAEVALLATKAEVALLATKAEVREEGEKTRRHMDVVAEHITARMALLFEGHTHRTERLDGHDSRLQAVEARQVDLHLRVEALTPRPRRPR